MSRADSKPPEEIEIRPATADDAVAICDLLADLARTLGTAEKHRSTAEDIRRFGFGSRAHFEALIAENAADAVGLVLYFTTFSTWRGRPGLYVQDLHVVEPFRGAGVGRRLLAAAARQGRAAGCTHMRLSVDLGNESARAFYRRMGLAACDGETTFQLADSAFDRLAAFVP